MSAQERVYFPPGQGYSCYDLNDDANLLITPSLFLPEEWCACIPGWSGNGIECVECEETLVCALGGVVVLFLFFSPHLVILLPPQGPRWGESYHWIQLGTKENTFSVGRNAPNCTPCPESATITKGSKSVRARDGTCKSPA